MENFVVLKNGKYMSGHSYASGVGRSFSWTHEKKKAQKFDKNGAIEFSQHTNGKVENVINKSKEKYVVIYVRRVMDCDDTHVDIKSKKELDIFKSELKANRYPHIHDVVYYAVTKRVKIKTKNDIN